MDESPGIPESHNTLVERKPDYGLYVGILFGIVSVLFFLLQSNGVEVNWQISAGIYLVCTIAVVWTTLTHALPGNGRARYVVALVLAALWVSLGIFGTRKQYVREHHPVAEQSALDSTGNKGDTGATLPPPAKTYMVSYGTSEKNGQIYVVNNKVVRGKPSSEMLVNGEILMPYADKFRLVAICFHMGLTDQFEDDPRLSKSSPTNIREGWVPLIIPWSDRFVVEMGMGAKGTNYALLLTPKTMQPSDFGSIGEAKRKGAYLLQSASGPP